MYLILMPAIFPTAQIVGNSEHHDKYLKIGQYRQLTFKCILQHPSKPAKLAVYKDLMLLQNFPV